MTLEFVLIIMKIALVIEFIGFSAEIIAYILYKNDCCTDKVYGAAKDLHFVGFLIFETIMIAGLLYSMSLQ